MKTISRFTALKIVCGFLIFAFGGVTFAQDDLNSGTGTLVVTTQDTSKKQIAAPIYVDGVQEGTGKVTLEGLLPKKYAVKFGDMAGYTIVYPKSGKKNVRVKAGKTTRVTAIYKTSSSGKGWTLINSDGPKGTCSLAFDTTRHVAVAYCGRDEKAGWVNDTWEWNGIQWHKINISGTRPPAGYADNGMAYDAMRSEVILYGGWRTDDTNHDQTWIYTVTGTGADDRAWVMRKSGTPSQRGGATMAYDSLRGNTYLFGGNHWQSFYNDVWMWNGTTWISKGSTASPRWSQMVYDSGRDRIILFGGAERWWYSWGEIHNDTWELNPATNTWTRVIADDEIPLLFRRMNNFMSYDPLRHVTVLYGGGNYYTGVIFGDTWEYNGITWQQISVATTAGNRAGGRMWYDDVQGAIFMYDDSADGTLWMYR